MSAGRDEGPVQNWTRREWFGMVGGGMGGVALTASMPNRETEANEEKISTSVFDDGSLVRADLSDPVPSS